MDTRVVFTIAFLWSIGVVLPVEGTMLAERIVVTLPPNTRPPPTTEHPPIITTSPTRRIPPCEWTRSRMKCKSEDSAFSRCREYNGTIVWVHLSETNGLCGGDDAWGFDDGSIWVDNGCQALFDYCVKPMAVLEPPFPLRVACPPVRPPCCEPGKFEINLERRLTAEPLVEREPTMEKTPLRGVQITGKSAYNLAYGCSQQIVVAADFERITPNSSRCFGCLEGPMCGRRMLKIDLVLSHADKSGWLFNVGDSSTNNGYGGDSGTQKNDAEVYCNYPNITIFGHETCGTHKLVNIYNGCGPGVHSITLHVSNEQIRIQNNQGLDYLRCVPCLFALNGQPDTSPGGVNERVYIGLNRVVGTYTRSGHGVCSATFSWACPWCD